MIALQYDFTWTKDQTYQQAMDLVKRFLKKNNIPEPEFHDIPPNHYHNTWQQYGLYSKGKVWVNVRKSTVPRQTRGRVWSFPGHKTDRTAAGILAHEVGHHVSKARCHTAKCLEAWPHWVQVAGISKPVSSYCPNAQEEFAETMRLFILNPDLLAQARKARYRYLAEYAGLEPVVDTDWKTVLINAPTHIRDSAQKFIQEAT